MNAPFNEKNGKDFSHSKLILKFNFAHSSTDTPLAPFFEDCINEQDLDEMNIEIIRNTLYKSYLESFFNFCKNIGGETEVSISVLFVKGNGVII